MTNFGKLFGICIAVLLSIAVPAKAAPLVTYHITGLGAGSLDGSPFANAPYEFLLLGDPSTVSSGAIDPLVSASVSLTGFGTPVFSIPTRLGLNNTTVFFSNAGPSGADLFDFDISASNAAAFNFSAPYGPVPGSNIFLSQFKDISTSLGLLSLTDSSDVLFSATASPSEVPLPAALPLFASGLGLMGWFTRRKKRKVARRIASTGV